MIGAQNDGVLSERVQVPSADGVIEASAFEDDAREVELVG